MAARRDKTVQKTERFTACRLRLIRKWLKAAVIENGRFRSIARRFMPPIRNAHPYPEERFYAYLALLSPRSLRSTYNKGTLGAAALVCRAPLTVRETVMHCSMRLF